MVSALITLWAVLGELFAIWLLIGELGAGEGFTSLGVTMLRVLLVIGALALLPYTVVKIKVAVRKPEAAATQPVPPLRVFKGKPETINAADDPGVTVEGTTTPGE